MVALTRAVGRKKALEMLLTGEPLSAEEALLHGLVNRVVGEEALPVEGERLARAIADASPLTIAIGKQAFYRQIELGQTDAYAVHEGSDGAERDGCRRGGRDLRFSRKAEADVAGRVDQRFAAALAALLGGELVSVRRLGEEVIGLELEDGRRLVAKGVARQSLPSWEPGRPWAELVALDALSAAGAPVPKVVAADLEHGWLVTEFVSGDVFEAACSSRPGDAFSSLARGLIRLEDSFAAEWEHLQNWAVPGLQESRDLAAPIVQFLDDPAQGAWAELTSEAMTPGAFRQGPLDVRAANVVWGRRCDVFGHGIVWV